MSFSGEVKEVLSKLNNLNRKNVVYLEWLGFLIAANTSIKGQNVRFASESQYTINRFSKLLSNVGIADHKIDLSGNTFSIYFSKKYLPEEVALEKTKIRIIEEKITALLEHSQEGESLKDFVRGVFLAGGSINNPEKKYHLEIKLSCVENQEILEKLLKKEEIPLKVLSSSPILYSKDGEEISSFLAWIGAGSAVLRFEEIRVMRDVRNNVNRIVNCETANLNKTVNSAVKQIEDIKYIKQKRKFNELSDSLKEIANLRLTYPEMSLLELGKLLKEPIGKSGVNHRLVAISKFAEELRQKEG